jgi:hypothetical protein
MLHEANYVSDQKKIGYFSLEALSETLERFTRTAVETMPSFVRSTIKPPDSLMASIEAIAEDNPSSDSSSDIEHNNNPFSKDAFFKFLLYPLEGPKTPKPVHIPTSNGPRWCWGSFIIPEFWFLWHEIWGACFLVLIVEYLVIRVLFPMLGSYAFLVGGGSVRIFSALWGHRIYYFRNGSWLKAGPNNKIKADGK